MTRRKIAARDDEHVAMPMAARGAPARLRAAVRSARCSGIAPWCRLARASVDPGALSRRMRSHGIGVRRGGHYGSGVRDFGLNQGVKARASFEISGHNDVAVVRTLGAHCYTRRCICVADRSTVPWRRPDCIRIWNGQRETCGTLSHAYCRGSC